jgi:hypothetical protein
MPIDKKPFCPRCGKNDQVVKVSQVYIESIAKEPVTDSNLIPRVLRWPAGKKSTSFRTMEERKFLGLFTPPSGKATITRLVNPDQVVMVFSVLAIFFLYQIFMTQKNVFPIAVAILAAFYIIFFLGRKKILAKFQLQKKKELDEKGAIEGAVGNWMKLYYCIRDDGVFEPQKKDWIPLTELDAYLAKVEKKK